MKPVEYTINKINDDEVEILRNGKHEITIDISEFENSDDAIFSLNESIKMISFGEIVSARSLFEFIEALEENVEYTLEQIKETYNQIFDSTVDYSIEGNQHEIVVTRGDIVAFKIDVDGFNSVEEAVEFSKQQLNFVNQGEIIGAKSVVEILERLDEDDVYTTESLMVIAKNELKEKYGDAILF